MLRPDLTQTHESRFVQEAEPVLADLQQAFAAIIESVVGSSARPTDLRRALKIDVALAWGVHRTAFSPTALHAGLYVPGPTSVRKFLRHARNADVPSQMVAHADECHDRFIALAERHADDRAVLGAMLADLTGAAEQRTSYEKQKRAAFRASRFLLGQQTQTIFNAVVLARGTGDDVNAGYLTGEIGLRYFRNARERTRVVVFRSPASVHSGGSARIEPLIDPPHPDGPICLMPRSTSQSGIRFEARLGDNGYQELTIRLDEIGKSGAASFMLGWIDRGHFPSGRTAPEPYNFSFFTTTPAEMYINDVIVFDETWDRPDPSLRTFARRKLADGKFIYDDADLLPVQETVRCIGRGMACAHTSAIPNYVESLELIAARFGRDPRACRVFRAKVGFPILHTYSRLSFAAPPLKP